MKANDNELLQNKVTGSTLTATEYQDLIDAINYILTFAGTSGSDFLTIGADAETNIGSEQSNYIYAPSHSAPNYGHAGGPDQTAIGRGSKAFGWKCTSIGSYCWSGNLSAVAIGVHCFAAGSHTLAIGRGAVSVAANGTVIGSRSNLDMWIGCVQGNIFDQKDTDGNVHPNSVTGIVDMSVYESRLRGPDNKDWRENPDGTYDNGAGGHTAVCGGVGTGTGDGGEVRFKTAPTASKAANEQNTLIDAGKFDAAKGEDTRFLLLDTTDNTLKRVEFGADDSAGTGYKTLKVAN